MIPYNNITIFCDTVYRRLNSNAAQLSSVVCIFVVYVHTRLHYKRHQKVSILYRILPYLNHIVTVLLQSYLNIPLNGTCLQFYRFAPRS